MNNEPKKRGRPVGSTSVAKRRKVSLQVRWSDDEVTAVEQAAASKDVPVSKFIRAAVLSAITKPTP